MSAEFLNDSETHRLVTGFGSVQMISKARQDGATPFAGLTAAFPTPAPAGYLRNPGMGFQGFNEFAAAFPQSVIYRRGQDHGYTWAQMNPAQGVFNWASIDADLSYVAATGQKLSFRIYPMAGENYGPHFVPQWVIDAGAIILPGINPEPDYRSRVFQQKWAVFTEALRVRYDGNPLIAYIDVAGYGEFSQWGSYGTASYAPIQAAGVEADPWNPVTLDGHARKHLIAIYCGGSGTAKGLEADGARVTSYAYNYPGFTKTQLLMPYNGLWEPTQVVLDHHPDVGLRDDYYGYTVLSTYQDMGHGATDLWKRSPVLFESVANPKRSYPQMLDLARAMGATFIHDNNQIATDPQFAALLAAVGYRYSCEALFHTPTLGRSGGPVKLVSTWRNGGTARAYPLMGQDFTVKLALADTGGTLRATWDLDGMVTRWLPRVAQSLSTIVYAPALKAGTYTVLVAVENRRTRQRLALAQMGDRGDNWYAVSTLTALP